MAFAVHDPINTLHLLKPRQDEPVEAESHATGITRPWRVRDWPRRASRWLLLAGSILLLLTMGAFGQTSQPNTSSASTATAPTRTHHATKRRHSHAKVPLHMEVAPVAPAPPVPVPPAEQTAQPATIAFASGQLSIDAKNSSLVQILNQIARQTGLEVQGLDHDERIYGQYGPGNMASTLTALLDGSGYNYVIVGGGDNRPPSKLLLTRGSGAGSPAPTAPIGSAGGASTGFTPAATQPTQPPNPSDPTQPKTPQQIFDELRKMHPQ